MSPIELENALQEWGYATARGGSIGATDWPASYGSNPIAVGMEYALGSRSAVLRSLTNMDRSGSSRRRIMGGELSKAGMRSVPQWACDPVPSKATSSSKGGATRYPPDIERTHAAVMALYRTATLRGMCIICEYQVRNETQGEKAVEVGRRLGQRVLLNRYRDELKAGKLWLHGRLSA